MFTSRAKLRIELAKINAQLQLDLQKAEHEFKEKDLVSAEMTTLIDRIKALEEGAEKFVASIDKTNTSIASTQQMLNALGLRSKMGQ